ncbi:hypothetical protein KKC97_01025 [bacterium]|nr:hypothetical protein [bacterium]MBU1636232.1 hypothetical protein [bacterium]MBU1919968.1 hypothetical protein [bacterium]
MQFKSLAITKAVVCLAFGGLILFVPRFAYGLFGVELGAGGVVAGQEYAAAMLGTMMLLWFARNAEPSGIRRAIALGMCTYNTIGFIIVLMATLAGVFNALGWAVVVIYLYFAVGFGFLSFINTGKKTA